MPLNHTGSNPIINVQFDKRIPSGTKSESGTCTIFIRKAPPNNWIQITTIFNSPSSSHIINIDPSIYLGSSSSVKDLIGAEVRYNVLFLDIDGDNKMNCSFDLEITQDGLTIISKAEIAERNNVESISFTQTFAL